MKREGGEGRGVDNLFKFRHVWTLNFCVPGRAEGDKPETLLACKSSVCVCIYVYMCICDMLVCIS